MTTEKKLIVLYVLLAGLFLRLILTPYFTHTYDINTWKFWANQIVAIGFPGFFDKVSWSDYLPFYFYILYGIEKYNQFTQTSSDLIFKIPAIFADLGSGLLIFLISKSLSFKKRIILTCAYIFNPAIFANSAMWGQVDGLGAFMILLCLYLFIKKKITSLGLALSLAALFKPLYVIALVIFGIAQLKSNYKKIPTLILSVLVTSFLITLPFSVSFLEVPQIIFNRYLTSLGQYHYASVNAFNLWALLGQNWVSDEITFYNITSHFWGLTIFASIFISVCLSFLFSNVHKLNFSLTFVLLVVFLAIFTFPTRVHERHLLTVFPFLVLCLYQSKVFVVGFILLSIIYLLNLYFGIEYLYQNGAIIFSQSLISIISFAEVTITMFLLGFYFYEDLWIKKS